MQIRLQQKGDTTALQELLSDKSFVQAADMIRIMTWLLSDASEQCFEPENALILRLQKRRRFSILRVVKCVSSNTFDIAH